MSDRFVFDRQGAERIARAVRRVESMREGSPLVFSRVGQNSGLRFGQVPDDSGGGKTFRIGTFTGAWDVGATTVVTFKYVTNTPNTVTAVNLFLDLPDDGQKDCAIAKNAGTWHLVQWQWVTVTCGTATATP